MAQGKAGGGGLGHPSLIYDLCLAAGVITSAKEEIQHPKPAITLEAIRKLGRAEQPDRGPDPRAMGSMSSSRRGRGPSTTAAPTDYVTTADLEAAMRSVHSRVDQYFQRQEQQFHYLLQVQQAIASASGQAIPIPQVPDFTPMPAPYSTSTADDEGDEETDDDEADEEDDAGDDDAEDEEEAGDEDEEEAGDMDEEE